MFVRSEVDEKGLVVDDVLHVCMVKSLVLNQSDWVVVLDLDPVGVLVDQDLELGADRRLQSDEHEAQLIRGVL